MIRLVTVGCIVLSTIAHTAEARDAARPNIVFILADDVGIEPLGCYGGTSFKTPMIDQLARSGTRFNHCYSMPVCHPTRICFLTGQYPRHIGNSRWGSFPKELEDRTIAQVLKRAGYATAVAGKWQLSLLGKDRQQPHRMGFDEYCLFGWHEGPRYHEPMIWQNGELRNDTQGKYGPDLYVDFLCDFFRQHRDEPFFAFYSMALCHDVTDDLDAPVPYVPHKNRYLTYAEMVQSMDQCVGRIVKTLDDLDLRQNTWVVFTGDNGTASRSTIRAEQRGKTWHYVRDPVHVEMNGQRYRGGKGLLKDSGTRVPLIVSRPGHVGQDATSEALIDFSDFLPTFAELSGRSATNQPSLDGISFADLLSPQPQSHREWAYSEHKGTYWVRNQRYKLYSTGSFYDVREDPQESHDLRDTRLDKESETHRSVLQKAIRRVQ